MQELGINAALAAFFGNLKVIKELESYIRSINMKQWLTSWANLWFTNDSILQKMYSFPFYLILGQIIVPVQKLPEKVLI